MILFKMPQRNYFFWIFFITISLISHIAQASLTQQERIELQKIPANELGKPQQSPDALVAIQNHQGVVNYDLSPEATANLRQQIDIIRQGKEAQTPVQKKINPSITIYLHTEVLLDQTKWLPKMNGGIAITASNNILVDISADVTDDLLQMIARNDGTILNAFVQYHAIRAQIPITAVETIAAHPDVRFIDKAHEYQLNKTNTSEGDAAHNAPVVRGLGYNGTGVKIGVISDSVDYMATVQASGDLPAVTVLQDSPGNSGEGTAMLEIVHDLAPGSTLYFATANGGKANFANNIMALKNAGCQVIVDDVGYFSESPFQDDVISQAVATVTSAGCLYFSSAANDGNKHSGTSGTYESDYVDSGYLAYNDFSGGVYLNQITKNPSVITLQWSDPLGASTNDYDLYIVDSFGNIIESSFASQNGTQDPYEQINVGNVGKTYTGYYVVVAKYSGAPRFLHLNASRGQLAYNTDGATKGHATVEKAFGVAAVSALNRTTSFTGSESVETFSSDGPRRVFYTANGTALTPGNVLHTGGALRQKPDITAADCIKTATPGFNPFCGTSAAAPHAAAMAAQLLSAKPSLTPDELKSALASTSLPGPSSWDDYSGFGIAMADRTFNALAINQTGTLAVTLQPAGAITAGAQWQVDGGAWKDSGATATGLTPGVHAIAFKDVTGWTTPASQTATVSASQTATAIGTYTQGAGTGSLTVTLVPAGVLSLGAQWQVDGGANHLSGETATGLSIGPHTVSFSEHVGWLKPASQTATIAANQTTTLVGAYTQASTTGGVDALIWPDAAVAVGAQWRVDNGTWRNKDTTLAGLAAGTHTISYKPLDGWTTPASQSVAVTGSTLKVTYGVYIDQRRVPGSYLLNAQAAYAWEDTSGATVLSQGTADDVAYTVPLGFDFLFYGVRYSTVYACTNGFVSFGMPLTYRFSFIVPNDYMTGALAAVYLDDLIVNASGSVSYKKVGETPNSRMVITWNKPLHAGGSQSTAAFQIILYEATGVVKMQYQNVAMDLYAGGSNAVIGIQNVAGVKGTMYAFQTPSLVAGQALTFTPVVENFSFLPLLLGQNGNP